MGNYGAGSYPTMTLPTMQTGKAAGKPFKGKGHLKIGPHVAVKQRSLLALTPYMRQKRLKMALGSALAFAIRDRIRKDRRGPDGRPMGPFENSGGMWRGYEIRSTAANKITAQFYGSSPSTDFAKRHAEGLAAAKRTAEYKKVRDIMKALRAAKRNPNLQNRWKAVKCAESFKMKGAANGREILEPTREEVRAIYSWLEVHLDKRLIVGLNKRFRGRVYRREGHTSKRLPPP